ncbi:MAG: hypothetical protein KDA24_26140 [Deltaproteobacteria bacterium]|nr:hypothetical protein [Deltaproteobacteria bacterium]
MDTYTRVVLTVIAAALVIIALRGVSPIPNAYAGDRLDCRIDGPIEVKGLQDLRVTIRDTVEVKQAFSEAGSSSSSPVYIKSVD